MTDLPPIQGPAVGPAARADSAVVQTELPADLTSARQARSAVRQALAAWGMEDLSGDAELLASELVANSAEHGEGNSISLALRRHVDPDGRPSITCEVTDTAPWFAPRLAPGPDAERGRGLAIIETLARSCGVRPSQAGRVSWFTLTLADPAVRDSGQIEREPEARGPTGSSSAFPVTAAPSSALARPSAA
jgi:anti-sigma regulatory factor (Ser/Thr protein kinase)